MCGRRPRSWTYGVRSCGRRPAARGEHAAQQDEHGVDQYRENGGGDHRVHGEERAVVEHRRGEQVAQRSLVADQRADADQTDAGRGRHAQPGHDRGYGDGQLDLEVAPQRTDAHGRGGGVRLLGDRADAVDDRRDEDHQTVEGQRDHHGGLAQPGVVDEHHEEGDRRDRVEHRGDPEDRRIDPVDADAQQADRQRQQEADEHWDQCLLHVCGDQAEIAALEVARDVEEAVHRVAFTVETPSESAVRRCLAARIAVATVSCPASPSTRPAASTATA